MIARKITSQTALDPEIRELYETAFPVEEQIPLILEKDADGGIKRKGVIPYENYTLFLLK